MPRRPRGTIRGEIFVCGDQFGQRVLLDALPVNLGGFRTGRVLDDSFGDFFVFGHV